MKTVSDINFNGKRVLTRVDFNVPLNDRCEITDDTRIRATLPTIKTIMTNGGKPVLMSHLGRPKGVRSDALSLKHLVNRLEKLTGAKVIFVDDCIGDEARNASMQLGENEILLLENLRFYSEETQGDNDFAAKLAENGDFYVNDAFGTAHRAHASTAVIAENFEDAKALGLVMAAEIENVSKVLNSTSKPVTAIVGGAKVSSKIGVLEHLMPRLDNLIIGGGMAFTFIKAMGGEIGSSLVEDEYLETARSIMQTAKNEGVEIYLPQDSWNADSFSNDAKRELTRADEIPSGWMGLDAGPETLKSLEPVLLDSAVILWNGPMGVFEFSNFESGTLEIAKCIARATTGGSFSIVGGGDSVAAVKKFGMTDQVSYVSTGGGAMLEYLEGKDLPGIKVFQE